MVMPKKEMIPEIASNDHASRKAPQHLTSFLSSLSFRAESSDEMRETFHEDNEEESRNLTPLRCPQALPLPPSCTPVFTIPAITDYSYRDSSLAPRMTAPQKGSIVSDV